MNFNDTGKFPDFENPRLEQHCGSIFCIRRVLANFVLKFPNFRCHGNRGQSDVNFSDTSELPNLELI